MSDIARALEMKRPALYYYFRDLEEVCLAVLTDLQESIYGEVVRQMAKHRHPIDQLKALMLGSLEFYAQRRQMLMAVFQLSAVSDAQAMADREREFYAPQRAFLIKLAESGIQRGLIAPCDPAGLIDTILVLMDGALMQRVTQDPNFDAMVQFVTERVLDPLRLEATPS